LCALRDYKAEYLSDECQGLSSLVRSDVLESFGPSYNCREMLTLSLRNVPFGWDHKRNTSLKSIAALLKGAEQQGIKTIYLVGQTPSPGAINIINSSWKGQIYDVTHNSYVSSRSRGDDLTRIHTELFVMSRSKYHFLPASGIPFVPYLLKSLIAIYDNHSPTPDGPECIVVPRLCQVHRKLFRELGYRCNDPSSNLDLNTDDSDPETLSAAMFNLYQLDGIEDISDLRAKAIFSPYLHLYAKRIRGLSFSQIPGEDFNASGYKSYSSEAVIQLSPDLLVRVF